MDTKQSRFYEHTLRLRPALGDWTKLRSEDRYLDSGQIGNVNAGFDALSRQQLDAVHHIHYVFSEPLMATLSRNLGAKVELHSLTVRQLPYEKISESENRPLVQTDVSDNRSTFSILLDWELARTILQRLLGNRGPLEDQSAFTRMELGVVETALTDVLTTFRASFDATQWNGEFSLRSNAGDFQPLPTINGSDAVVVIQFVLAIGKSRTVSLRWIYARRTAGRMLSTFISPEVSRKIDLAPATLAKTRFTLAARLGTASLTMADVTELRTGDIVLLDQRVSDPIYMTLNDKEILKGRPGVSGRKLVVQVIHPEASSVAAPTAITQTQVPEFAPVPAPIYAPEPPPEQTALTEEGPSYLLASPADPAEKQSFAESFDVFDNDSAPLAAPVAEPVRDEFSDLSAMDDLDNDDFSWDDLEEK